MPVTGDWDGVKVHVYDVAERFVRQTPYEKIKAVLTGEFRAPLKGEWYLSGAIPEAYRAPNNLKTEFHICRLVRVSPLTIYQIKALTEEQRRYYETADPD